MENSTLSFAQENGMKFYFETRENYRNKDSELYLKNLKSLFGNFYLLPEGGTNTLAILGCEEILTEDDNTFDYICCSVGTGGTISGLINTSLKHQKIIGFSALSGGFLKNDIRKFVTKENWELIEEYTFGGYAKTSNELIAYINSFYNNTKTPLDPVYTGKMMFGIEDLIKKNYFQIGSKILAIHTGGLQGVKGMNVKLENKKLQKIEFDV
jgi:1-aminocyclopropane-1-carboxylate deaminase